MKLLMLGIVQMLCLSAGISAIASVAPDWSMYSYWPKVGIGVFGLLLIIGGLTMRDLIREATHKREQQ